MPNPSSQPTSVTSVLSPLKIEIGGLGSASYKSIDEVVWENIPPLAVLTGVNGSGKTQLLELLAYKLTDTEHPQMGNLSDVRVVVTGDTIGPDEVAYLPNEWSLANPVLGIAEMQNAKQNLFGLLQPQNIRTDITRRAMRSRLERLLGVPSLNKLDVKAFVEQLPDDFGFMLEETNVTAGLGHVFLAYRLRCAEELERGTPSAEIPSKIGPAPWDVVNETFQAAEFPYRVVSPLTKKLLEPYELRLENPQGGQPLRPSDLSSGEIRLLGFGTMAIQHAAPRTLSSAFPSRRAGRTPSSVDDASFPKRRRGRFGRAVQGESNTNDAFTIDCGISTRQLGVRDVSN